MEKKKTSLVFTGDIGFDRYMEKKWEDDELIAPDILDFLHAADHVIANVEGPVYAVEKDENASGIAALLHTIDPAALKVLRRIRANIWNINNNHIMDAGKDGIASTLKEAKNFGARTVGAGMNLDEASRPLYLDEAGGVGMIAVGYRRGCKPASEDMPGCLSWADFETIEKKIKEIKARCRWCIVISHGGEEFTSLPMPYTRDRYLKFLEMGADIIVCHHPHVPMNYETFPGKAIFYSLGNFIFDTDYQRAQFNTEKGLLLRLDLTEADFSFEACPLKIDREAGRIVGGEMPKIFADVNEKEYNKLVPLAAKAFVAATKRREIFLNPEEYTNAPEEKWHENLYAEKRSGRVPGEALDFQIVCPLAEKEADGAWKSSKLSGVVEYMLEQL